MNGTPIYNRWIWIHVLLKKEVRLKKSNSRWQTKTTEQRKKQLRNGNGNIVIRIDLLTVVTYSMQNN